MKIMSSFSAPQEFKWPDAIKESDYCSYIIIITYPTLVYDFNIVINCTAKGINKEYIWKTYPILIKTVFQKHIFLNSKRVLFSKDPYVFLFFIVFVNISFFTNAFLPYIVIYILL